MSHLLEVNNLVTRFYTEAGKVHAVNGISYTLNAGESMAIVGESGSGKTVGVLSLMRMIQTPPGRIESGSVFFKDRDLLKLSAEEMRKVRGNEISMVFQDPMTCLNPVLSIGRQLTEGMQTHLKISKQEAETRAVEYLGKVGIPNARERLKDYPHQFSGGQRQRVDIAMALCCEPELLIADEPTTALDVTIQAQIVELVQRLQAELHTSIIWITHDLGIIAGLVQKVAVMYSGFIVEQAPTIDLYELTSHPYTLGLLDSLPSIDDHQRRRLVPIEGLPPDLLIPPSHCPFAPRCRFAEQHCWQELPPLTEVAPKHFSACWRWPVVREISTRRLSSSGEPRHE